MASHARSNNETKVGGNDVEFVAQRRLPKGHIHKNLKKNVIFIDNKSDFKGQIARCMKLLESSTVTPESHGKAEQTEIKDDEPSLIIRGLGAALPRTINLALQLSDKVGSSYSLDVSTSTVKCYDDAPGVPDTQYRTRETSSIEIKFLRSPQ